MACTSGGKGDECAKQKRRLYKWRNGGGWRRRWRRRRRRRNSIGSRSWSWIWVFASVLRKADYLRSISSVRLKNWHRLRLDYACRSGLLPHHCSNCVRRHPSSLWASRSSPPLMSRSVMRSMCLCTPCRPLSSILCRAIEPRRRSLPWDVRGGFGGDCRSPPNRMCLFEPGLH